jgi:hypothetical protein
MTKMYKSKLIELFRVLNKEEIRQLKKWLHSPLHNEHKEVLLLFEFILSRYKLNEITLKKQRAWKYVSKDREYADSRMRHLMSFALNTLEEFVRYKSSKSDEVHSEKKLAQYYYEHQLDKFAAKSVRRLHSKIQKSATENEAFHLNLYQLEVLRFEYTEEKNRTKETNIGEISRQASLFFMISSLRYACTALSQKSLSRQDYQITLLEAVLSEVGENDYTAHPVLMIYFHGYHFLNDFKQEAHYQELKPYLYHEKLHNKERRQVLLLLLNYAIKGLNTGNVAYRREAFELYRSGIESKLIFDHNILTPFAYKNIVSLGIILGEYDYLESFIPEYATKMQEQYRESYRHYSYSRLLFAREEYEEAMQMLVQIEYDDLVLNMGAKVMLIKLYYQQQHFDALDALLESFRIFLNRKQVMAYHKKHYNTLIRYTKKMLRIIPGDKQAALTLQSEIEREEVLAEKKWLIDQLNLI